MTGGKERGFHKTITAQLFEPRCRAQDTTAYGKPPMRSGWVARARLEKAADLVAAVRTGRGCGRSGTWLVERFCRATACSSWNGDAREERLPAAVGDEASRLGVVAPEIDRRRQGEEARQLGGDCSGREFRCD
ncbi:SsgA family sporulation/cell division regulator [Sesbania bispinosa]|nr:SsgA family sporulation/cell division regulator [Sesbania bispinosa]